VNDKGLHRTHWRQKSFRWENEKIGENLFASRLQAKTAKVEILDKRNLGECAQSPPYLFWFSVGGPILSRAINLNVKAPFAFIGSFYVLLIGSKMLLAVLVGRSKSFLNGTLYKYIMRLLGLALCILALLLFRDGMKLLGILKF
jgi:hypothetical protein